MTNSDRVPGRWRMGEGRCRFLGWSSLAGALAVLVSACAPTATVTRAGQLADAGIAYADALDGLAGVAETVLIDWRSRNLIDVQASVARAGGLCGQAPARLPHVDLATCAAGDDDADVDCAWLTRQLACADAQARRTVELTDALSAQLAAIRRYFAGLKALAGYDAATRGGDALKGFADAVDALSADLRGNPLLDGTQVEGISELGALVFDGYKSEALKRALRRDAATIDVALAWQQAVFEHLTDQIEAIEAQKASRAYRESVLVPFLTGQGFQADAWVAARRDGLATPALPADISRAAAAATSLREVWRQILSGADDLTLLSGLLDELDALAAAVAKLKGGPTTP